MKALELDQSERADVFDFLEGLRESGKTNMFGAAPYLQEAFGHTKQTAQAWLSAWMKSYTD